MRFLVICAVLVSGLLACENKANRTNKADSIKLQLDTTLHHLGDSIEAKGERTLDTLKAKFNDLRNRKDTVRDSGRS